MTTRSEERAKRYRTERDLCACDACVKSLAREIDAAVEEIAERIHFRELFWRSRKKDPTLGREERSLAQIRAEECEDIAKAIRAAGEGGG